MNFRMLLLALSLCLMSVCVRAEAINTTKEQRALLKKDLELQTQEIESQLYSGRQEGLLKYGLSFLNQIGIGSTLLIVPIAVSIAANILCAEEGLLDLEDERSLCYWLFTAAVTTSFISNYGSVSFADKLEKQKKLKDKLEHIKDSLREISVLDAAEEQRTVAYNK